MPRFKVRAEGDIIRFMDQAILESIKMPGRYLHSGANKFPSGTNIGDAELDLASHPSSFLVTPHYRYNPADNMYLKGCDVICLFHKELSSFLAAEGVFTESDIVEEPHLRERYKTNTEPKSSLRNATTFWQVEVDGEPLSGDVIAWDQTLRLKHLTTRKYLCLVNNKLTLTGDFFDKNAVFRFRPVSKTGIHIESGFSATLEHPISSKYFHCEGWSSFLLFL